MQNIDKNIMFHYTQNIFDFEQQGSEPMPYTRIVCNNNMWNSTIDHKTISPTEPDCSKHKHHKWIQHSVQENIDRADIAIAKHCSNCNMQLTKCQTKCRYCGRSGLTSFVYA